MSEDRPGRPPFEHPKFEPNIPAHLLKSCNEQQKFLIERLSVLEQQQNWQMEKVGETHEYCRSINGKVIELEQFRQSELLRINSEAAIKKPRKWLIGAFIFIIYPVYLQAVQDMGLGALIQSVLSFK